MTGLRTCQRVLYTLAIAIGLVCASNVGRAADPKSRDFSQPASGSVQQPTAQSSSTNPGAGVSISKQMPARVTVGEPFVVTLTVRAAGPANDVVVRDAIPDNAKFGGSDPQATLNNRTLSWALGDMKTGETRQIAMQLTPTRDGPIASCATVTSTQEVCVATVAGTPKLAVSKTGPETALLGSLVPYTISVKNVGTAEAKGVVLTDAVPAGMSHSSGLRSLAQEIGNLQPGETRSIQISLKADQRGNHCNTVVASATNAPKVQDQACTLVQQQGISVAKSGTKEQFVNKRATYDIVVKNTGDTTLTNVQIIDYLPESYRVVDAANGRVQGATITWTLERLAAGATQRIGITVVGLAAGTHCNRVAVSCAEQLTDQAEACTLWTGHSALLLELVDTEDPLLPGEITTYIIRVTNQGTADDRGIRIVGTIPPELQPLDGDGDSDIAIKGQVFQMGIIPKLAPKQAVEWRLRCKAVKGGDARLRLEMNSELLKLPVHEEESTHVY